MVVFPREGTASGPESTGVEVSGKRVGDVREGGGGGTFEWDLQRRLVPGGDDVGRSPWGCRKFGMTQTGSPGVLTGPRVGLETPE